MASSLRCVFRIAAGPRIGFGHLMRARALARALGVRPRVSIRGGTAAARVARTLGCVLVPSTGDPIKGAHVVIVDDPSPRQAQLWIARARRRAVLSVAVGDRMRTNTADLVVDGCLTARTSSRARALLGSRFYILDPRMAARCRTGMRQSQGRIVIALGGGTHVIAMARRLVSAIRRRCPSARIAVAPGFTERPRPPLSGARWLSSRRLAGPLSACDVAVLAGGVTLHEGCALGVPIVGLAVVAGQRATIRSFASRGAVVDAGRIAGGDAIEGAADSVEHLLQDAARRRRVSSTARRLVDGRGAVRVAERIRAICAAEGAGRV